MKLNSWNANSRFVFQNSLRRMNIGKGWKIGKFVRAMNMFMGYSEVCLLYTGLFPVDSVS